MRWEMEGLNQGQTLANVDVICLLVGEPYVDLTLKVSFHSNSS